MKKWKYNIPKLMGCSKRTNKEVNTDKCFNKKGISQKNN